MYLYLTIVSILQNVIRKILRRRPCQNFLPGVLCVTPSNRGSDSSRPTLTVRRRCVNVAELLLLAS